MVCHLNEIQNDLSGYWWGTLMICDEKMSSFCFQVNVMAMLMSKKATIWTWLGMNEWMKIVLNEFSFEISTTKRLILFNAKVMPSTWLSFIARYHHRLVHRIGENCIWCSNKRLNTFDIALKKKPFFSSTINAKYFKLKLLKDHNWAVNTLND